MKKSLFIILNFCLMIAILFIVIFFCEQHGNEKQQPAETPAKRAADQPFSYATELKYDFLPPVKMEFINGKVKNTTATALFDIDAQYSKTVKVDGITFDLPGEICEASAACYKADFNNDNIVDYLFVNIIVHNGRFTGKYNAAVYVSNVEGGRNCNVFSGQALEAVMENGKCLLVKYDYSDDGISFIRQLYTFDTKGYLLLVRAEAFAFDYNSKNSN